MGLVLVNIFHSSTLRKRFSLKDISKIDMIFCLCSREWIPTWVLGPLAGQPPNPFTDRAYIYWSSESGLGKFGPALHPCIYSS